ncbi:MAG: nuclear transport factor 2 family protein [Sphingobium sp.]
MDVEREMRRLLDEEAVKKIILRFGRSLDLGDWPGYRSCFTDMLLVDFERLTGQPKILVDADDWTRFADLILSPVRRHHAYTNFHIEVTGDEAKAVWYFTARHWKATDMGSSLYYQHGWYDGSFIREDGDWKMSYVKHDFVWVDGNNALFDMAEPNLVACMTKVFSPENVAAAATR